MGHRDIDMIARSTIPVAIYRRGSVGVWSVGNEQKSMRKRLSLWVVKARVRKSLSEKHGKDGGPSSFRFLGLKEICCLRRNWLPEICSDPFSRRKIRKKAASFA